MRRKFLLAMMVLSLLFGAMGGVGYLCAHNGGYPNVASGINDDETKDAVSISTYEGLKEALQTSGNYQLTADITVVVDNEIVLESICVAKIGETSYSTLQEAINAVQNSETITLLEDCAEQISFTQTADKSFVIDGNQKTMTGNFNITARAGKDALSTLEIKNFNFVTAESSYDFIKSVETNYYPNNITISGCTFKGTSDINAEGYAVVAVRLKSANNITIKDCTAEGLHSFLQNTAGWNISINNVDITNSLSGLACGTVQGINVKECEITTKGFGIRLDAQYNNNAVIESNKIEAFIPVVVRKASVVSSLTFNGTNTMTQTNTDDIWCAIGTSEYETNGTMPTAPTGQVTVTLNDTGLSIDGVYGECHKFAGEGTAENPYLINNVYELKYFRDQVNSGNDYNGKYIQLNADIDLDAENWIGIGSAEHGFMGNFDGKEYTIKNLNIVETEAKEGKAYIGLFGYAKNTTIKNVTFDNVNLNIACLDIDHSQGHIGAVAGSLEGTSTIENVTVKGDVKVEATFDANGASRVAVVAGGNSYGDVTMKNVHVIANEGSYLKANNNVGALAGQLQNKSVFENCSSNIDVTGKKFFAGGIIGLAACDQTFTKCSTTGNVTITAGREGRANDHYRVGGIAGGWSDGKTNVCTLTKCTYTGTISGTNADGSVAYPLDYAGYVGRGYTLTNCAGSKVIIGSVEYVQAYNDKFGIYYVDGKLTINTADALKVVAENSSESVDIVLGSDITLTETIKINAGQTRTTDNVVTIDLNGNTITGTDNKETGSFGLIEIQPGAELIINDSSEDKSGKITLTATYDRDWNAYSSVISNQRGKLTVNGGTIEHLGGTDMAYAIDNLTNGKGTYAETIINGGTIKSTYRAIRQFLNGTEAQNILTVNGGTIEGTNKSIWMQEANASANPGTLKVYETSVVKGDILLSPAAGATEWPVVVSIAEAALEDSSTVLTNDHVPTGYDLQLVDGVYGVYSVVAKIGDVKYQTLQEAFNAVADNGTITVLSDVTITSATACVNGSWIDGVKYTGDKSFTVDFGGYTITDDGCINDYLIYINNMGEKASEITFQNGTIVASNGCWATVCVNGNSSTQEVVLNLKGMNITNSNDASYSGNEAVRARNLATINVNDGTTITSNGASYGITAHAGGIVNIEEKATIEQKNSGTSGGNSVFAAVGGNGQVNIKGGTIISDRYGVHTMTTGTPVVNISGGTITALVALKASTNGGSGQLATINVSAGTITGDLETYTGNAHIILTGGIYTVDPSDYVAEHYAAKELGGNLWTVVQIYGTQTRELACAGWYWFSTYIQHDDAEAALDALQTTLGTNASTIKGQHGFTQYLNHNGTNFWSSGLTELSNSQMYMIKTKADNVAVELTGNFVDYETSGIELNDGWNWISYPVNQEMNLSDVISSDDLKDGDIIKSQFNGSATYYENHQLANGNVITGWIGDLKVMKPGFGYMFKSASERTFNYTTSGNNSKSSLNTIDYNGDNHWFADATQYPNNMTMIAMLSIDGETVNGNYEVAAFANGECRGSARPIYIEALDAHVLYMTIHGEDMAELTFKYYDVNYGTEYELANRVTYSDDAVIGSLDEPYMLTLNITDIDELSLNEINIYPNPTTTGSEINLQAVCDKVEVYNSLGVKVAEYHNVDSIDALETAGIYVIRITDNGDVKHCRLVVK